MGNTTYGFDATQLRLIHLERDGQWFLDHYEAEECHNCGGFVADVNSLFGEVFDLDTRVREDAFKGVPYSPELANAVEVLLLKCYCLSVTAERLVMRFERKGRAVEGAEALRRWRRELEACNKPGDEVPDWLEEKRLAALEEHRQGKTLAGWAD